MQAGFALYAAGVVRAKNIAMVLLKNFMDACIAALSFWLVGYAFAFGAKDNTNGFIGHSDFALQESEEKEPTNYAYWFWNWAFSAAATTILSGSIAERATFHSYLMYSFFMTIFVYPVVAHWMWSDDGWLNPHNPSAILGSGAIDFAGTSVVHLMGGFASVVGSIATGPRTGRFDSLLPRSAFKGGSPALYVLGTFLLWFGWYGFNPGSFLGVHNYHLAEGVSRAAVCTTLSTGTAAIFTLFLSYGRTHTWDLLAVCTGALAGLVSITGGCAVVTPWASVVCGVVAAPILVYGEVMMEWLKIDDPVSAFPVHGLCGIWGMLFTGFLAKEEYVVAVYDKPMGERHKGAFYNGSGDLLLNQVISIGVIMGWTVFWMSCLFFGMRFLGILRVPLEEEAMGMDRKAGGDQEGKLVDPKGDTKLASTGYMPPLPGYSPTSSPDNTQHPRQHRVNGPTLVTISEGGYTPNVTFAGSGPQVSEPISNGSTHMVSADGGSPRTVAGHQVVPIDANLPIANAQKSKQVAAKTMTPKDMEMQLQAKEQEGKEGRKGSLGPGWDEFFWKSENQR